MVTRDIQIPANVAETCLQALKSVLATYRGQIAWDDERLGFYRAKERLEKLLKAVARGPLDGRKVR